jgi:transcriptional regulator with XRE-family HTH domain
MKAPRLLKQNIDRLLRARGQTRKDLAMYCHRTESWVSQIFTKEDRGIPLKYLDRIADFFGLATYQLFQPGISPLTERRSGRERRSGMDRRISRSVELLQETPSVAALEARMRLLTPDAYRKFARRVEAALTLTEPGAEGERHGDLPPTPEPPSPRSPRIHAVQRKPPK